MTRVTTHLTGADGRRQDKEFDILAVNGTEAAEVKTALAAGEVREFIASMEDFKRYFPDCGAKRVYGAVAYLKSDAQAAVYAERQGLFVIRAAGGGARIVNAEGFRPVPFPTGRARR